MKRILVLLICLISVCGCSGNTDDKIVDYMEAKEKIINEGAILLDVRTEDEYNTKHIDGALLLSLDNINEDSITDIASDKNQVIIVYCKSGNRSNQALTLLEDLGYTEVYDLGAMSNWEE